MRISDELLPEYYRLVMESASPRRAADGVEARARAVHRAALTWGGGGETAEDHFTRVVREGGAPEEVAEAVLPAGETVHLPALLAEHLGIGSTSEARRLIGQGAVKVNGEAVSELDLPRDALEGPSSRPENVVSCAFAPLDTPSAAGTIRKLLDGWRKERPCNSTTGAPSDAIGYEASTENSGGLWRESEAFFTPVARQRSLKTQQRETSRPRVVTPRSRTLTCHTLVLRGWTFELKLIGEEMSSRPLARRTTIFTESLILAQDERWRRA